MDFNEIFLFYIKQDALFISAFYLLLIFIIVEIFAFKLKISVFKIKSVVFWEFSNIYYFENVTTNNLKSIKNV